MRRIIGFGASTMQGAGDSRGGFFARLQRQWTLEPAIFINLGIGGDTTREMLARVDANLQSHLPYDTVVVLLGSNDLPRLGDTNPAHRTTLPEYLANVETLLSKLRAKTSLFVTPFPVDRARTGVAPNVFAAYLDAAQVMAEKAGFAAWDPREALKSRLSQFWADDGLHFNDAGHQWLADGVEAQLRELLTR